MDNAQLTSAVQSLQTQVASLQNTVTSLQSTLASVQSSLASVQQINSIQSSDISNLKSRLSAAGH